jgi:hypothetical protein
MVAGLGLRDAFGRERQHRLAPKPVQFRLEPTHLEAVQPRQRLVD